MAISFLDLMEFIANVKFVTEKFERKQGQAWETWAQYGGAPHSSVTVRFPWLYRRARYFRVVFPRSKRG